MELTGFLVEDTSPWYVSLRMPNSRSGSAQSVRRWANILWVGTGFKPGAVQILAFRRGCLAVFSSSVYNANTITCKWMMFTKSHEEFIIDQISINFAFLHFAWTPVECGYL